MKKLFITLSLMFASIGAFAQLGFDFGLDVEFLNRKAPGDFKSTGFGMGPYVGAIYGIPVSMSDIVNIGLNYKFDFIAGAMGATFDENKIDPFTFMNADTDIMEHHIQLPVMYFHGFGRSSFGTLHIGPVFDYCLSSTTKSTATTWTAAHGDKVDNIKDLGMKPFNIFLRAGIGFGGKTFGMDFYGSYGLLDQGLDLTRWCVGFGMHLNL